MPAFDERRDDLAERVAAITDRYALYERLKIEDAGIKLDCVAADVAAARVKGRGDAVETQAAHRARAPTPRRHGVSLRRTRRTTRSLSLNDRSATGRLRRYGK
jgi:hypothetical protein